MNQASSRISLQCYPSSNIAKPGPPKYPTLLLGLLGLGLLLARQRVPLRRHALLAPLAGRLGLCALGVHLLLQDPLTGFFGLGFVDLVARCSLVVVFYGWEHGIGWEGVDARL